MVRPPCGLSASSTEILCRSAVETSDFLGQYRAHGLFPCIKLIGGIAFFFHLLEVAVFRVRLPWNVRYWTLPHPRVFSCTVLLGFVHPIVQWQNHHPFTLHVDTSHPSVVGSSARPRLPGTDIIPPKSRSRRLPHRNLYPKISIRSRSIEILSDISISVRINRHLSTKISMGEGGGTCVLVGRAQNRFVSTT